MGQYEHPEAYCLMAYGDSIGNVEIIWNSRDGVTPFIVRSRQGRESQHVDWQGDERVPNHVPLVGDRVFEDQTEERVRQWRTEYVEKNWSEMRHSYPGNTKDEVLEMLIEEDMKAFDGHAPQITVVTEEWLAARMVR